MPLFQIKTISIKECGYCQSKWSGEKITLNLHDKIDFIVVKIAYCPACAEDFASEIDRPTYRREGKRIR